MPLVADIVETYYRPGAVHARRLAAAPQERDLLALLAVVCLMTFLLRLPPVLDMPRDPAQPLEARVATLFVSTMLFGPLFLYALAALSHLAARMLGGRGGWFQARLALFWTLFAFQPLVALAAVLERLRGGAEPSALLAFALTLWFLYAWILGFRRLQQPLAGVAHEAE